MTDQVYGRVPLDPGVRRLRLLALAGILTVTATLGLEWGSLALTYYTPGYTWVDAWGNVWYVAGMAVPGGEITYRGYQTVGRVVAVAAVLLTVLGLARRRPRLLWVAAAFPLLGLVVSKPDATTVLVAVVGATLLVASGLQRGWRPAQQPG